MFYVIYCNIIRYFNITNNKVKFICILFEKFISGFNGDELGFLYDVRTPDELHDKKYLGLRASLSVIYNFALPQDKIPIAVGVTAVTQANFSWPQEKYLEVLKKLILKYDFLPLFFGAPHEQEKIMPLINELGTGRFVSEFKAVDAMAIMSSCRFYLGNDTGTMHMADCAGIPCITLFSNRDYCLAWSPEGEQHINLIHRQPCGECRSSICPYGMPAKCIAQISITEVENAVDLIMNKNFVDIG